MVFFFHHEAIISLSHPKNRLKQRSAAALILQSNLILVVFLKTFLPNSESKSQKGIGFEFLTKVISVCRVATEN